MQRIPLRDGQYLYARVIGHGKPVVLLHGFASNSSHWLPNVLPLMHRFRFILPDMRGFGASCNTAITQPNVFQLYAHDLNDLLDYFQLDDVILGGLSTGAYACLVYNQLYGFDRVGRYLNIEHSPEARNHDDWQHGLFRERQAEFFDIFADLVDKAHSAGADTPYWSLPTDTRRAFALTLARILSRAVNNPVSRTTARLVGRYAEPLVAGTLFQVENWYAYIQVMQAFMQGNDTRPWLHRIQSPTTLMMGAESRYFSLDGQLEIKQQVPHAKVVIFEKSGHIPMLDQPLRFQRAFHQFLLWEDT